MPHYRWEALAFKLDHQAGEPLYKQLSNKLIDSILTGELKPGDYLPPTRHFCEQLGLSRCTVVESYKMLVTQGYLEAGRGVGSRVSRQLPQVVLPDPALNSVGQEAFALISSRLSSYSQRMRFVEPLTESNPLLSPELNFGATSLDLLPLKFWRQSMVKHMRSLDSPIFQFMNDSQGYAPLRQAIAGYVARSRSVRASSDQVAVFSGFQHAIECISRVLLDPGDWACVENPGFMGASRTIQYQGAQLLPIPVDGDGMIVSALRELAHAPKLIYVTPSLQDPTGVPLSLPRRLELLDYARKVGAYIIEDDYDSEYRYGSRPIPSLQSLDEHGTVIYIATFRKMLYPIVRLAFLVLPSQLVPIVKLAKASVERDLPMLEQCVLTEFIGDRHLERHIQRTRSIYNKRRQQLVRAIAHNFGRKVTISRENSGTHLVVLFRFDAEDAELTRLAQQSGVTIVSTRSLYHTNPTAGEFLWPFSYSEEDQITSNVAKFARKLKEAVAKTG